MTAPIPARLVIDGRRLTAHRTGVGRYLETLLNEWSATALPAREVLVVLADAAGLARVPHVERLSAVVVVPSLPGLLWERFGLLRTLRRGDLLFAPANLVPAGWGGPTVLVMHDALQEVRPSDFSRWVRFRFGRRYRRAIARADRVVVPSRSTADDLKRVYGVSNDRVTVIPPACGPDFRPRNLDDPGVAEIAALVLPPARKFFLFMGKQSRRRNVPAIRDAFALHRRQFPDHYLAFVGDEPTGATVCEFVSCYETDATSNVETTGVLEYGHVEEEVIHAMLATATALLYPSEHEGFGLPVIEAMASGCPVVTLRRKALVEVGGDGPIYLDEARPEAIAEAMAALVTNPEHRVRHIDAGLARTEQFTPEAFAAGVARELRRAWEDWNDSAPPGTRR